MRFGGGLIVLVLAIPIQTSGEEGGARPRPLAEVGPPLRQIEDPKPEAIQESINRGVAYLIQSQNTDGSWGSAMRTKDLNIYAPVPGAHRAFRGAVTALCVSALVEAGSSTEEVSQAIDRGEAWLLENLPKLQRANEEALYNVWGHAYGIEAFVRLHARHSNDSDRRTELLKQIAVQVDLLDRYESVHGGWGYYDFTVHSKKPATDPNSFVTATVLIALHQARALGVDVPQRLIDRGLAVIQRQQKPDLSYVYSEDLKYQPAHPVNMPGGSIGRTQACNAALRLFDDKAVSNAAVKAWLQRLFTRNLWLDIGRKRPIPHESWYMVAGYFFYYGHYYSGYCIGLLDEADRPPLKSHLALIILQRQEKDGSWFDFPLYDYHQAYGTAFALMTLKQCQ